MKVCSRCGGISYMEVFKHEKLYARIIGTVFILLNA